MNPHHKKLRLAALLLVVAVGVALWWFFIHRRYAPLADLKPTLILISIDGFRADYFEKYKHPTLTALAGEGVRAQWLTPSYPSLTFPNHYTIATGLYPEHHGIIANDFYDPDFDGTFSMNKRAEVQNGRWWGGEPIWITAEKQGQRAAAVFWPGSEAEIGGMRPTYWRPFENALPDSDRVDSLLALLDLPVSQRPTFLTLYFSDVDHEGHEHSPDSVEVAQAITVVDGALERLVRGLRARNINEKVNIIVVSDHGMAPAAPTDVVILDDYFQTEFAQRITWGHQVTNVFPKTGAEQALWDSIRRAELPHARCYHKQDIPARFHYQASRRIAPIVCMADEGWRMFSRQAYAAELEKPNRPRHMIGAHGYDNQLPSMRALFIARGPAFKHGVVIDPFPNVNVYPIMTSVLGLAPAKNEGDPATAQAVLR